MALWPMYQYTARDPNGPTETSEEKQCMMFFISSFLCYLNVQNDFVLCISNHCFMGIAAHPKIF